MLRIINRKLDARRKRRERIQVQAAMIGADGLRDQGDLAAAARAYEAITLTSPKFIGSWKQLGNMRKDLGEASKAELAYLHALDLDPEDRDVPVQLGHLSKALEDLKKARAWYEAALEFDPDNVEIQRELEAIIVRDRSIADLRLAANEALPDLPFSATMVYRRLAVAFSDRPA